jgi:hypothetical protein
VIVFLKQSFFSFQFMADALHMKRDFWSSKCAQAGCCRMSPLSGRIRVLAVWIVYACVDK